MTSTRTQIILLLLLFIGCATHDKQKKDMTDTDPTPIPSILSGVNSDGYARADQPIPFHFPRDHGPHPDFRSEWWYLTGNLTDENGRPFGFQFTIFRTAITPDSVVGTSDWRTRQFYMGHFAISDIDNRSFYPLERFSRGALGLAGAQAEPFRVWLDNWSIENVPDRLFAVRLKARSDEQEIDLTIRAEKPMVLQGDDGLSQKGPEPGNASYYYSFTRMTASGTLSVSDQVYKVAGQAWFDREWSTSALSVEQVGWDWFSLQLDNGQELMWYQIRVKEGTVSPNSAGKIVGVDGQATSIAYDQVELHVLDTWNSPSGRQYPGTWQLKVPSHQLDLTITPRIPDQEWTGQFRYWEGSVGCVGMMSGQPVAGSGYVELTGY